MNIQELFPDNPETMQENSIRLLEAILENPPVGVGISDGNGQILYVNDILLKYLRQPKEVILHKTIFDLEQDKVLFYSSAIKALESGKPASSSKSLPDGQQLLVHGFPVFDNAGVMILVVTVVLNLTYPDLPEETTSVIGDYSDYEQEHTGSSAPLIYHSTVMRRIVEKCKRIAETDVSVLITGPSGVGKELIADLIHTNSPRRDSPFIKINCAAIPEQLLESELFGYEPGAFTGGNPAGKKGLIESANGGTLLLDEIGELPLLLQSKLLRALQERMILHLGGSKPVSVNFRLISSTNENLEEKIANKEFREDLYYRLNVINVNIPPLEERKEDIPFLVSHFIRVFNAKYNMKKNLAPAALAALSAYHYPGNVRELRNILERLVIESRSDLINLRDVNESMGRIRNDPVPDDVTSLLINSEDLSLKQIMERKEKALLREYLKIYKTGAALSRHLKTDQSTISRKLNKYGLID